MPSSDAGMTGAGSGSGGDDAGAADHYSLAWVVPDTLATSLDSATYLETTDLLRKSGWDVTLIAIGPPGVQQIRGIETRCFRRARPGALGHARWHLDVLAWIRRQRPDVVLFPAASAPYF